jgi:O-antigen/teichoic acid export membrane protein
MTQLIKYGMIFRALVGTLIFIVNFVFAEGFATILLSRPDLAFYIRIASFSVIFQIIFTTATSAFVGLDRTEYNALTTSIQAVAKSIISVALVLLGLSVAGALVGHVVGYTTAGILGTVMLFILLKKHLKTEDKSGFTHNIKTLMNYGVPLYISALLTGFIIPYENLILAIFTSDADVGNFKAATNFVTLITLLSVPITTALIPAFSKLNSTLNEQTKNFFKLANKYTALLIVPTACLIMIFSSEIVEIIYGSIYQSAALYLSIYCSLYFLTGIGYLTLASLFNGLGETKIVFKTSLIQVSMFAILAPLMTRTYSVPGLIIAFLISNAAGAAYGCYIARTKFKIEFAMKSIIRIYSVSLIAGIPVILYLQFAAMPGLLSVIVGGVLYLFAYMTLIPIARIITLSELEKADQILQKIKLLKNIVTPLIKYQKIILRPYVKKNPQARNLLK